MPEIVAKNPTNDPSQKPVKTHSKFTPNYSLYATHQFGLISPFFAMEGVADDDITLRTSVDTDTYTMKAPVMQPVKRSLDYFQVPFRAIMPKNAELLITNPLRGDDVIARVVAPWIPYYNFQQFFTKVIDGLSYSGYSWGLRDLLNGTTYSGRSSSLNSMSFVQYCVPAILRYIQVLVPLCSAGGLLSHLGANLRTFFGFIDSNVVGDTDYKDVDWFVDRFFDWLKSQFTDDGYFTLELLVNVISNSSGMNPVPSISSSNTTRVTVYPNKDFGNDNRYNRMDLRYFINNVLFTERSIGHCTAVSGLVSSPRSSVVFGTSYEPLPVLRVQSYSANNAAQYDKFGLNLYRLLAYQIACAEFFTSDAIDDVYSTSIWHNNMLSLAKVYLNSPNSSGADPGNFKYNGLVLDYDGCSGHYLQNLFAPGTGTGSLYHGLFRYLAWTEYSTSGSSASSTGYDPVQGNVAYGYFHNIFGFNRSLKFQDYFVGSRTRPLAVGDVTVSTNQGNGVNIIDVSKNIQVQRFLNQVNRVGRKFSDYVKGILGDKPLPDAHEAIFLGHVVDTLGAEETANTGADQYSRDSGITSKFRDNSSRYAFEVHVSEPSILIGVLSYDIPRVYSETTDRDFYHLTRYDLFNPYMQFVGDQEIYAAEIGDFTTDSFGYQIRYAEYRQRTDRAVGGFVSNLPGYAKVQSYDNLRSPFSGYLNQSSDFIRSRVTDIDEFYLRLTGFSPSSYFHFIDRVDMSVTARRPMAFAPSIL